MADISGLAQPQILPWVAVVLGLCIGSFLNVVIHRLPKMMERDWRAQCAELGATLAADAHETEPARYNLVVPRSRCPSCGHGITALENIPVVSWLILRGKCSACAAPISARPGSAGRRPRARVSIRGLERADASANVSRLTNPLLVGTASTCKGLSPTPSDLPC